MVPCKNVYNCILEKPFKVALNEVAIMVHLKMKFYNIHDELVMVNANLSVAKRIYKAFQQDYKEGEWKSMKPRVKF